MKQKQRSIIDWIVLGVVVMIAGSVISLSYTNTQKLAIVLGLNPILTGVIVEVVFGWLLFIRSRQRATTKNVPWFLHLGYFCSFLFVTSVNMWGLAQTNTWIGCIVGVVISCTMWLMETILVWLWVDADKPHTPSARDLKKEAKRLIKEEKIRQEIGWMLYEAAKPNLDLIERAREEEQRRQTVYEKGIPIFFQTFGQTDKLQTDHPDKHIIDKLKTMGIVGQTLVKTFAGDKTTDRQDIDDGQTTTTKQTASDRQTNDTTTDDQTQMADSNKTATAKQIGTTTRQLDRQTIDTITQTGNMGKTTDRHQDSTVDNTATSSKVDKTKRQAKLSLIKGKNDKDKIVRQKAIDYYNQTGKFPSYRQLGEMAGVSKDKAGKIIRQLKTKIS